MSGSSIVGSWFSALVVSSEFSTKAELARAEAAEMGYLEMGDLTLVREARLRKAKAMEDLAGFVAAREFLGILFPLRPETSRKSVISQKTNPFHFLRKIRSQLRRKDAVVSGNVIHHRF